jgi:hypothetical protein
MNAGQSNLEKLGAAPICVYYEVIRAYALAF